ncbi:MAG: DUF4267 domain-containing protein [Candidatus Eremiobacteraeota bacterium]|nr:DUF4267 domain-containing protein [Candidatus Eremiobacteraeota bacterium]
MTAAIVAVGWIVGLALVIAGIAFFVAPRAVAPGYGVRVQDHAGIGYARATGVRDVALGIAVCACSYFHDLGLLAVLAIGGMLVSIADFFIAYHHGPERRLHPVHAIHASGIVAFALVLAMALFAVGR